MKNADDVFLDQTLVERNRWRFGDGFLPSEFMLVVWMICDVRGCVRLTTVRHHTPKSNSLS